MCSTVAFATTLGWWGPFKQSDEWYIWITLHLSPNKSSLPELRISATYPGKNHATSNIVKGIQYDLLSQGQVSHLVKLKISRDILKIILVVFCSIEQNIWKQKTNWKLRHQHPSQPTGTFFRLESGLGDAWSQADESLSLCNQDQTGRF